MSSMVTPALDSASSRHSANAGDRCTTGRWLRYQMSWASAQPAEVGDLALAEAPGARRSGVRDDDGGAHVDVHHGVHVLRVRVEDHAVLGRDRHDLLRVAWSREPRPGVGGGDGVEAGHEVADGPPMGVGVVAGAVGDRRLEQRVHGGGLFEPMGALDGVHAEVGLERRPGLGPARRARPLQAHVLLLGAPTRGERLGAGDQDPGTVPLHDELGGPVHQPLGDRPAHARAARLGARRAEARRQRPRRVAVAQGERVHHVAVGERGQQGGAPAGAAHGVRRLARRLLHQDEGVGGSRGVLLAARDLAAADDHRDTGPVHRHVPSSFWGLSGPVVERAAIRACRGRGGCTASSVTTPVRRRRPGPRRWRASPRRLGAQTAAGMGRPYASTALWDTIRRRSSGSRGSSAFVSMARPWSASAWRG